MICLHCGLNGHYVGECKFNPFWIRIWQAELSSSELDFADSDSQFLIVLLSEKEIQVTWTYSKKVVDSAKNGTKAIEKPNKLLTFSMRP